MNENNNEQNGQNVPAHATEPMAQPIADGTTTAEIPVDATLKMPPAADEGTAAETPENTGETAPREPWDRKITQSGGATAAVAAGALVVIGLVSGLSACAGAHLGSADDPCDHRSGVERLMEDRAQAPSRDGEGYGYEGDSDDAFDSYDHGYGRGQGGGDLSDEYDGNDPSDGTDSERGSGRERGGERGGDRGFTAPNGDEDQSADEQPSDGDQSGSATDDTDRQDDRRNRNDQQRPDESQGAQDTERPQAPEAKATA